MKEHVKTVATALGMHHLPVATAVVIALSLLLSVRPFSMLLTQGCATGQTIRACFQQDVARTNSS